jgi:chromosome segregation ATPase
MSGSKQWRADRLVGLVMASLAVGSVWLPDAALADQAATRIKREREMMMRRMQQQTQEQLAALEQEKAKLNQDLEASAKQTKAAQAGAARANRGLKAAQDKSAALEKELEQVRRELAASQEKLAKTEAGLTETTQGLNEMKRKLAATEVDKSGLEAVKTRNEREIALCEEKNGKLYGIGRELMTRLETKRCNQVEAGVNVFTGQKKVEVENLLEEYRDKLDEEKILKAPGG